MSFQNRSIYFTDNQNPDTYSLENQLAEHLEFRLAKDKITVTPQDTYTALALSIRDRMVRRWLRTQQQYIKKNVKKVYYLSLEYLMGRLLGNALTNLGFYDECKRLLDDIGYDLEDIRQVEKDMGLGNGGLGRLAACFLDSMATEELPAFGYGIRYEYGIFDQEFENGWQVERPDNWLSYGCPWEIIRPEHTYRVKFGGKPVTYTAKSGKVKFDWIDTHDVLAVAYDIPVPGYNNNTVNNLRLWQAKSTNEFSFKDFNQGNYVKAVESKNLSENISKVLYPNDTMKHGKELRLQQQYFFVSATLQDIIRKFKITNPDFSNFYEKNVIHLNDTHPAVAIPELMRIFMDDYDMGWDEAWHICKNTFAYTNHTVLSEALEKWPSSIFEEMLPRHLQIIYEINRRYLEGAKYFFKNDFEKMRNVSIFEEGGEKQIRMSNLSIIGSFSVNGVAALHTDIIKKRIFSDFYEYEPHKFNNKTNGITQRRWLKKSNPFLSDLVSKTIGEDWVKDLSGMKQLEQYAKDSEFQRAFLDAKWENKKILIKLIEENYYTRINPNSMFDSQVKRIHEYKRQLLNVLHVIHLYNKIKDNPNADIVPRTVIFGGKSAPGYTTAKLIIKLINSISGVINNDPDVGDKLKVLFLKNYSVSLAERIIPATDLSEQISTAGYEASGTGNMKFQLNGALTIGTLDGANVEMKEEVGDDNIFIFGMNADEVVKLKANGYNPRKYYEENEDLKRVLDMINSNYFCTYEPDIFRPIFDMLVNNGDQYCLLADYQEYIDMQKKVAAEFIDTSKWVEKAILNVARSGKFSSDRTIRQYAKEIWNVGSCPIPKANGNGNGNGH